jgi:hypothetical protein
MGGYHVRSGQRESGQYFEDKTKMVKIQRLRRWFLLQSKRRWERKGGVRMSA